MSKKKSNSYKGIAVTIAIVIFWGIYILDKTGSLSSKKTSSQSSKFQAGDTVTCISNDGEIINEVNIYTNKITFGGFISNSLDTGPKLYRGYGTWKGHPWTLVLHRETGQYSHSVSHPGVRDGFTAGRCTK